MRVETGAAALMVSCSLVLWAGSAATTPLRKLEFTDLVMLKTPGDPQVSPDGSQVAYTLSSADTFESRTRIDILSVSTDGGAVTTLAGGPESETTPRWSPDGSSLAFLVARSKGVGVDGRAFDLPSDETRWQVWIVGARGGEVSRLTTAPEGVESYQWAPDGLSVVYLTSRAPSAAEKAKREADRRQRKDAIVEGTKRPPREFWSQPVSGGEPRRLFTADPGVEDWDLADDGKTIVYSSNVTGFLNDESLFDLWIVTIGDSAPRRLTSRFGPETSPVFSPNGEWVAFQADQDTTVTFSQEEIGVVPVAGGAPRFLTTHIDFPATVPQWTSSGSKVSFEVALGPDNLFHEVRLSDGDRRDVPGTPAAETACTFQSDLSRSRDGQVVAYIGEGQTAWPDVWVSRSGGQAVRLTDLNPELAGYDLPEIQFHGWLSTDGLPITGFLVRPPAGVGRAPYPTIVYPHGGPYNRSTRRLRGIPTSLMLASHGYLVLEPNYRGSRGFSEAFGQANRNDFGGGDYQDILSGVDALVAQGLADSAKLGITGGSYGGYLTNWAIANTNRFKAAVTTYGIFNFITDFSNAASPSYEREYLGAYYWDDLGRYWDRSPISKVRNITTPVLLLHGDLDHRVSIANAREMWTALTTLQRTVEFVHYPRERHGFSEPNHRIDAARRTLAWFEEHLGTSNP